MRSSIIFALPIPLAGLFAVTAVDPARSAPQSKGRLPINRGGTAAQ